MGNVCITVKEYKRSDGVVVEEHERCYNTKPLSAVDQDKSDKIKEALLSGSKRDKLGAIADAAAVPVEPEVELIESAPEEGGLSESIIAEDAIPFLTDDGQGNYVFFHYGKNKLDVIDPNFVGSNPITSRSEAASLTGADQSFYYTVPNFAEQGVGNIQHQVLIPQDKVYDITRDSLNFYDEARSQFKDFRGEDIAFDKNAQVAWVNKVAQDNGFQMGVARWQGDPSRGDYLRGQSSIALSPEVNNKEYASPAFLSVIDDAEISSAKDEIFASIHRDYFSDEEPELFSFASNLDNLSNEDISSFLESDSKISDEAKTQFRDATNTGTDGSTYDDPYGIFAARKAQEIAINEKVHQMDLDSFTKEKLESMTEDEIFELSNPTMLISAKNEGMGLWEYVEAKAKEESDVYAAEKLINEKFLDTKENWYHGFNSDRNLADFDPAYASGEDGTIHGAGLYFTNISAWAESYGDKRIKLSGIDKSKILTSFSAEFIEESGIDQVPTASLVDRFSFNSQQEKRELFKKLRAAGVQGYLSYSQSDQVPYLIVVDDKILKDNGVIIDDFDNEIEELNTPPQPVKAVQPKIVDSLVINTDRSGSNLKPERLALHKKIEKETIKPTAKKAKEIFIIGGATANGKSTFLESGFGSLPSSEESVEINSDIIKTKLPEYNELIKMGDRNAANFVHRESSKLSKDLVVKSLDQGVVVLYDTVGNNSVDSLKKRLARFRGKGYKFKANYVSLDYDLSIKLAENRAAITGRHVPLSYVTAVNSGISRYFPEYLKQGLYDEVNLWDTNIQGEPRLVLSHANGVTNIENEDLYEDFLRKSDKGAFTKIEALTRGTRWHGLRYVDIIKDEAGYDWLKSKGYFS